MAIVTRLAIVVASGRVLGAHLILIAMPYPSPIPLVWPMSSSHIDTDKIRRIHHLLVVLISAIVLTILSVFAKLRRILGPLVIQ